MTTRFRIGVVTARFNDSVTKELERGALNALEKAGVPASHITAVSVPGAVEIPLAAQLLFENGHDGVVVLGCVIRGETTHYDSVCRMVETGCLNVMLKFDRPIGFGVLTTESAEQALARAGGQEGHKGAEAAAVTLEMLNLKSTLKNPLTKG